MNHENDMQLEAIKEPTYFINQFKDIEEFKEWLEEGTVQDLEATLKAFENAELYEYCTVISKTMQSKMFKDTLDLLCDELKLEYTIKEEGLEISEKPSLGWCAEYVECPICTHRWRALFEEGTKGLECPNCGKIEPINIVEE